MRFRKPILCSLLLFIALLLTGCARNGESITLNIQLDDNLLSDEINLLYIMYIPMMEEDGDGLVVRTCPEDIKANSLVGHHYYVPTKRSQDGVFQLVIHSAQNRRYEQGETSIESSEIYLGERYPAILFHIEAWHFEDIDSKRQGSFGERFQRLHFLSVKKKLLYANNAVLRFPQDGNAVHDLKLLTANWESAPPSEIYWRDSDGDLFNPTGEYPDCIDYDTQNRLGCTFHPFAPTDGCIPGDFISCDCYEITPVPTATPTQTLTPTASNTPTITPTHPTATTSTTPTRTSTPAPTPTFNIAPLARATSAPPAQCPSDGDPELPDLASAGSIGEEELERIRIFLSEGGSIEDVRSEFVSIGRDGMLLQRDLTRDGVPEIIFTQPFLQVLGCTGGSYQQLLQVYPEDPTFPVLRVTIADLNGNTVPELVVETEFWGMHDYTLNVRVYEWDGENFINRMASEIDHPLLERGLLYWESGRALMYNGDLKLGDVDINGTIELVLRGGFIGGMEALVSAPQLSEEHIWMWNGREFTIVEVGFSEPTIKFHAASLGDLYSLLGKFEEATAFYQQAIFDQELQAWNVEWIEYAMMGTGLEPGQSPPREDYEQGQRISTYARYRLLLVNYLLGNDAAVEIQYQTLEKIKEKGYAGQLYAELAGVFRQAYLEEESITDGCRAAQQFAERNARDILGPLGPGVYGVASWGYDPEDICPFRDEDRSSSIK